MESLYPTSTEIFRPPTGGKLRWDTYWKREDIQYEEALEDVKQVRKKTPSAVIFMDGHQAIEMRLIFASGSRSLGKFAWRALTSRSTRTLGSALRFGRLRCPGGSKST